MVRRIVTSRDYHVPVLGFSQAVISSVGTVDTLYVSGLTARKDDGEIVCVGDPTGQTRQVLKSLALILAEVGGDLDDVVRIVTYLVNMEHHEAVHAVRREVFGDEPPASSSVEVSRLFHLDQLIEIEATAIIYR